MPGNDKKLEKLIKTLTLLDNTLKQLAKTKDNASDNETGGKTKKRTVEQEATAKSVEALFNILKKDIEDFVEKNGELGDKILGIYNDKDKSDTDRFFEIYKLVYDNQKIGKEVGKIYKGVGRVYKEVVNLYKKNEEEIGKIVKAIGDGVGGFFKGIGDGFGNVFKFIGDRVGDFLDYTRIGDFFKGIGDGFGQVFKNVGDGIRDFLDKTGIGEVFKNAGDGIGQVVKNIGDGFGQVVKNIGDGFGQVFKNIGDGIGGFLDKTGIGGFFKAIGDEVGGFFKNVGGGIGDFFKNITGGGKDAPKETPEEKKAREAFAKKVKEVADGFGNVAHAITQGTKSIRDGFNNLFGEKNQKKIDALEGDLKKNKDEEVKAQEALDAFEEKQANNRKKRQQEERESKFETLEARKEVIAESLELLQEERQGEYDVFEQAVLNRQILDEEEALRQSELKEKELQEEIKAYNDKAALEKKIATAAEVTQKTEEKLAKRKRRIARDDFFFNQSISASTVVIDTAVGIAKALVNPNLLAGIAHGVSIGILGGIQLGAIFNEKAPALFSGGLIEAGRSAIVGDIPGDFSRAELVTPTSPSAVIPSGILEKLALGFSNIASSSSNETQNNQNQNNQTQNNFYFDTVDLVEAQNEIQRLSGQPS